MTNRTFVPERDDRGIKIRADGKGDAWANAHRRGLGNSFYMDDVDGLVGIVGFTENTGNRLFTEYVPDNYKNREREIRNFATVALFDRKFTRELAFDPYNRVSLAYYLDTCRRLGKTQPKPPRFFFVIGHDNPPWVMIEIDIETGKQVSEHALETDIDWRRLWDILGLANLRRELSDWLLLSVETERPKRHQVELL